MNRHITVKELPKGGPYSHAVVSGNLVFVSGQTGQIPDRATEFEEQFNNAMARIKKILEEAGSSIDRVIKVSVYLARSSDFEKMNELFEKYFGRDPPARTTLVTGFVVSGILVEIDVIASK
ncbi:MAG: RidA family protein [Candidatus Parvarchaeota archaeon]